MNVYGAAHNLVDEIRKTDEYNKMIAIQNELDKNSEVKKLLFEFSEEQMKLNSKHMTGQEISETDIMSVQKKYDVLVQYKLANDFLETQLKYTNMMTEISKIINGE